MPAAPPALDLDRDEGVGSAPDEHSAGDAGERRSPSGSPSVKGGAASSPRAVSGGSPREGGGGGSRSPRWKPQAFPPAQGHAEHAVHADTPRQHHARDAAVEEAPLSNYLLGMLGDTGKHCGEQMHDRESELRREGVHNFLAVPWNIEPMLIFGYATCLDCFMHQFTLLPIRVAFSVCALARSALGGAAARLTPFQYCELLRGVLIVVVSGMVLTVDMSQAYHTVRNQAMIKLYVIFNMLEIFDKLCTSFGQDILEALYSGTLHNRSTSRSVRMLFDLLIALIYLFVHTLVLFYHGVALTCAVNSNNNVLITLLISNNFVELKSNVFKRTDLAHLFQISCSDMVERFQLSIYIFFVVLQYMKVGGGGLGSEGLKDLLGSILFIYGSELVVDWIKHAFVVKFNHISPTVYSRFTTTLCHSMSPQLQQHNSHEQQRRPADLWIYMQAASRSTVRSECPRPPPVQLSAAFHPLAKCPRPFPPRRSSRARRALRAARPPSSSTKARARCVRAWASCLYPCFASSCASSAVTSTRRLIWPTPPAGCWSCSSGWRAARPRSSPA